MLQHGMNLQNIMISEINRTQKDKYYMIPVTRSTQNSQIHKDRKQNSGNQGLGTGEKGSTIKWVRRCSG